MVTRQGTQGTWMKGRARGNLGRFFLSVWVSDSPGQCLGMSVTATMARSWHRLGRATEPRVGLPTAALFPQCMGRTPPPNDPVLKASNAEGETLISDHDPRQ